MKQTIKIPILKPQLPTMESIAKYIIEIDNNRWYTNFGPLTQRFEDRLSQHFKVSPSELITVSNGTDALAVALMSLYREPSKKKKYCLIPSWTFVATAAAVRMAGLEPIFVDIEKETWAISPSIVLKSLKDLKLDLGLIHSVIPVSPFGKPINTLDWIDFSSSTGIKVLVDAAASFDAFNNYPSFSASQIPVMISLHATKVFGVGEGAILISKDKSFIKEVKMRINFGFSGTRESRALGVNAKLSEYTSAVGLAELDSWAKKRSRWLACTESYLKLKDNLHDIEFIPSFGEDWISSYCNIILPSPQRKSQVLRKLEKAGIDTREWWGNGVHTHYAYRNEVSTDLPNTIELASTSFALPFFTDLTELEIELIGKACKI